MSPEERYHVCQHRGWWRVYAPGGGKVSEYLHREDAVKEMYRLNGWGQPKKPTSKMNKDQFIEDVRLMRKYQKDYFKTRSSEALRYAKNMEKRIDAALEKMDKEQVDKSNPQLFNG